MNSENIKTSLRVILKNRAFRFNTGYTRSRVYGAQSRITVLFSFLLVLSSCGASATQQSTIPTELQITMTQPGIDSKHWTVSGTAVQTLYTHTLQLTKVPLGQEKACRVISQQYTFVFVHDSTTLQTGTITQCGNLLQLGDHSVRAVDGTFWYLLDNAVQQKISPF